MTDDAACVGVLFVSVEELDVSDPVKDTVSENASW
jgi:hypothetical protein